MLEHVTHTDVTDRSDHTIHADQPHSSSQTSYNISDFDYDLPQELIAQTPIEPRDASRLLVVSRGTGAIEHAHFRDIGSYLRPGDVLIANQSRVIPARLIGRRAGTGGAVEVLLLAERPDLGPDHWETLVRPGRRLREGSRIVFGDEAGRMERSERRCMGRFCSVRRQAGGSCGSGLRMGRVYRQGKQDAMNRVPTTRWGR